MTKPRKEYAEWYEYPVDPVFPSKQPARSSADQAFLEVETALNVNRLERLSRARSKAWEVKAALHKANKGKNLPGIPKKQPVKKPERTELSPLYRPEERIWQGPIK